jgi:hypothetical protein
MTEDRRFSPVGRYLASPSETVRDTAKLMRLRILLEEEEGLSRLFDDCLVSSAFGFPLKVWADLQELHRRDEYWSEKGLSESGKRFATRLIAWVDQTRLIACD